MAETAAARLVAARNKAALLEDCRMLLLWDACRVAQRILLPPPIQLVLETEFTLGGLIALFIVLSHMNSGDPLRLPPRLVVIRRHDAADDADKHG